MKTKSTLVKAIVITIVILSFIITSSVFIVKSKLSDSSIDYVIGISQANYADEWHSVLIEDIKKEVKKYNNIRLVITDANKDIEKQKRDIDKLLKYGADLLIVTPCDSLLLTQTIKNVYQQIPVIVMDKSIQGFDYTLSIGLDNYGIGKIVARLINTNAKGNNYKVLELSSDTVGSEEKHLGLIENINTDLVTIDTKKVINSNKDNAEDLLLENCNTLDTYDLIFTHNDQIALGANKALKKLVLKNDIYLISVDGFDVIYGNLNLVDKGIIDTEIISPTGGKEVIQYAIDIFENKKGIPKQVILRNDVVSKSNLAEYVETVKNPVLYPKKDIKVAHVQIADEGDWRNANKESIEKAAKDFGIKLVTQNCRTREEQILAIKNYIEQGYKLIILSPVIQNGWDEILEYAKAKGITIFLSDRKVEVSDASLFYSFIGGDFIEEGRRAMRWIISELQPLDNKIKIFEIQGTINASPTQGRHQGFVEVLELMKNYEISYSINGTYQFQDGYNIVKSYYQSHNSFDFDVIFSHNDDMALGAIKALKELNINPGVEVLIVSIDGIKSALKALKRGELNCVVECSPLLGPELMKAIEDFASGKSLPKSIITNQIVFTAETEERLFKDRRY